MARGGLRVGAGRPGRADKVEDFRHIDAREMQRLGIFNTPWRGAWYWKNIATGKVAAQIAIETAGQMLLLSFRVNGRREDQRVRLRRVPCNYGGSRTLFHCPQCQATRAILLFAGEIFQCRGCLDLRYRTQAESRLGRLNIAKAKISQKLMNGRNRPAGMHRTTYMLLRGNIMELDIQIDDMLSARLAI